MSGSGTPSDGAVVVVQPLPPPPKEEDKVEVEVEGLGLRRVSRTEMGSLLLLLPKLPSLNLLLDPVKA